MQQLTRQTSRTQSGVIAVVVLLIMVVILTIGISIATRSSEEGMMTVQQEESAQVFNAAETGIERALSGLTNYEQGKIDIAALQLGSWVESNTNDALGQYQISTQNTLDILLNQGHSIEIPVNGASGNITINWAETTCDSSAALLIAVTSFDGSDYSTRYVPIDPCASRQNSHHFLTNSGPGTAPKNYRFDLALTSDDTLVSIKALYDDTDIVVSGAGISNTVQYRIIAAAKNIEAGQEAKAINVNRSLPAAPAFMDFALVSGNSISK